MNLKHFLLAGALLLPQDLNEAGAEHEIPKTETPVPVTNKDSVTVTTPEHETGKNFTEAEASEFAQDVVYEIDTTLYNEIVLGNFKHAKFRCIDGRSNGKVGDNVFPVPGGSLGFYFALLAALPDTATDEDYTILLGELENFLGGKIEFHSDEHHMKDSFPSAGCGYCSAYFADPIGFSLDSNKVDFLRRIERTTEILTQDNHADILKGEHKEHAIIIIDNLKKSAISNSGKGTAFIYHQQVENLFYTSFVEYINKKAVFSYNLELDSVTNIAQKNLRQVVKKIAPGTPAFNAN